MKSRSAAFIFFLLYLASVVRLNAQYYEQGYILTSEKDTVFGEVKYVAEAERYKKCTFMIDGQIKEYGPTEIVGYGISTDRYFETSQLDTMFLEKLVGGKVSLYKAEPHYFVKKEDKLFHLESPKLRNNRSSSKAIDDNTWRGILQYMIHDCLLDHDPGNFHFNEVYLRNLIIKYNECSSSDYVVLKEKRPWIKPMIGLGTGVTRSKLLIENAGNDYGSSYTAFSPAIGIAFALSSPRFTDDFSFYVEAYYIKKRYSSYEEIRRAVWRVDHYYTSVSMSNIFVPFSFKYNLVGRKNIFLVQAGGNFEYAFDVETEFRSKSVLTGSTRGSTRKVYENSESDLFDLKNKKIGLWWGVGIQKRFDKWEGILSIRQHFCSDPGNEVRYASSSKGLSLNLLIMKK